MAEHTILHAVFLVTCIVAVGVCLVYIFSRERAALVSGAGVNSYDKFLLDGALMALIIVLIWMGVVAIGRTTMVTDPTKPLNKIIALSVRNQASGAKLLGPSAPTGQRQWADQANPLSLAEGIIAW